jgi:hypothetical protein
MTMKKLIWKHLTENITVNVPPEIRTEHLLNMRNVASQSGEY